MWRSRVSNDCRYICIPECQPGTGSTESVLPLRSDGISVFLPSAERMSLSCSWPITLKTVAG